MDLGVSRPEYTVKRRVRRNSRPEPTAKLKAVIAALIDRFGNKLNPVTSQPIPRRAAMRWLGVPDHVLGLFGSPSPLNTTIFGGVM
jgi:hypothetical protein